MAQFHFVEDYERHIASLLATHPIDEAMALAVGGNFEEIGAIELALLQAAGLHDGQSVVDLGCGSGRLAHAIGRSKVQVEYTGLDIVQSLLDYARSKCPPHYRFLMNRELSLPLQSDSVDIACAFSVFTHLLHHESFSYIEEFYRVLRPGGRLVFSFLEFSMPAHWMIFRATVDGYKTDTSSHLNTFIDRNAIAKWAEMTGFVVERFIDGNEGVAGAQALGQSCVILGRI